MKNEALKKAAEYEKKHRRRRKWQWIVVCLAAIVVCGTAYALLLPAAALEKESCGLDEHTHGTACFDEEGNLICDLKEHTHTEECSAPAGVTGEERAREDEVMEQEPLWSAQVLAFNPLETDEAYISVLSMGTNDQDKSGGITDGSAPWDSSDSDGLDKNASNRRVRTFDTVKYDFYYTTALQDRNSTESYDSARIYFEFLLPATRSQAMFSEDEMSWLDTDTVTYVYEEDLVTVNGVSYQVLHGSFLDEREGSEITAASRSRDAVIRVLNMKNNSTLQPVFTMWLGVNDVGVEYENNIPKGIVYNSNHVCDKHGVNAVHKGKEWCTVRPEAVTVTCTPRYAVTLKRGEVVSTNWKGDFDFSTGNERALDRANETWNGEINAYGIRLMVQGLDAAHGLRGCELPEPGDSLEFDITLTTAWQNSNGGAWQYITQEFVPRVWSADEFAYGEQGDGRAVGGYDGAVTYAAPLNQSNGKKAESCKNGGTWKFEAQDFSSSNENHRVIHVTVSGYEFDPEHLPYTYERGNNTEFYNPTAVGDQWWNIQNAVFSTGEIWVVTPFYNEAGTEAEHYITKVKDVASLTMWQSIFAYNAEVKNRSGDSKYSKSGELYHLDSSITLQKNSGNFNAYVHALSPLAEYNVPLTSGCLSGANALKDYATPGSYVDLETWIVNNGAEGDSTGVAYNIMTKFDNACFEPVTYQEMQNAGHTGDNGGMVKTSPYVSQAWWSTPAYEYIEGCKAIGPKMLYGTTKDGKGWNHKGVKPNQTGYDEEMMKATPDDLIWYDSMEALKADGAECVAVLMEYRNVANDGTNKKSGTKMNHLHMVVHGKIKETAESGYVYAISNYAAAWTKGDVKELVDDVNEDGQIGTVDYLYYTQNKFPSYSPTAENKMDSANFPIPTHERSWKRCTAQGSGESGQDAVNGANGYGTATKSYLKDDGTFMAGSGGYYFQDNVYVVSYKSEVGIQVAQTTKDGIARGTYSMDDNQRVVDFAVTPRFTRSMTDTGAGGETATVYTDATVTVTLPQGLEYYPGTAIWGGSYEQDTACQSPGTVTGGQTLETNVVKNEDGTTTLTWILKNVPLSKATEDLAPVHFSCKIGNSADISKDVTNGQTLAVQTDIYSTADQGAVHGAAYNNQASTSIQIAKSMALTIIKTADQPIVDSGESMGFTMQLYNSADSAYTGWVADVLPYNGVGRSAFHGPLQIEEFKIIGDVDSDWKNVTFYYTTDTAYSGMSDVTWLDVSGWSEFKLDENYTWTPPAETGQITAIAYQCSIPEKGRIQMHMTLSLPESQPGDVIYNRLLLNNLLSNACCQVISRTLEGLTWMDDNGDGIQDEDANSRISGVKVTLLKLKDGGAAANESDYEVYHYQGDSRLPAVEIETGKQISVRAGDSKDAKDYEPGRYKFTDLPAGTFAVRFTDGSGNIKISKLLAAPDNRGTDDTKDSDGKPTYSNDRSRLEQTVILGIEMPKAEDMQDTLYESKYHDSGFYERGHELPMTGGFGTTWYTAGGLLLLCVGFLLMYRNKKRGKEDFASS